MGKNVILRRFKEGVESFNREITKKFAIDLIQNKTRGIKDTKMLKECFYFQLNKSSDGYYSLLCGEFGDKDCFSNVPKSCYCIIEGFIFK